MWIIRVYYKLMNHYFGKKRKTTVFAKQANNEAEGEIDNLNLPADKNCLGALIAGYNTLKPAMRFDFPAEYLRVLLEI